MKILKFGGSSIRDAACIRKVAAIVGQATVGDAVIVVSALGGVTDDLIAAARLAESRDLEYEEVLTALRERHAAAIEELAAPEDRAALQRTLDRSFGDLGDLLHGAYLLREASRRTLDGVVSYGERLSAEVVAAALRASGVPAEARDARPLVLTDDRFGEARVDREVTDRRLREAFAPSESRPLAVVTGFLGATAEGQTTTLGRGGSDLTATLLGAALAAEEVQLWTDVDAVMSADPKLAPAAVPLERLSYEELMELSHFGAKVVHPPSIHPTRSLGIPLRIKNTFRPESPGTLVTASGEPGPQVRGVTAIPEVALLRLEGDGMVGVPGIASRLFGALSRAGVSVILISQASSEHSICFAIAPEAVAAAARGVEEEFDAERRAGLIDPLVVEEGRSVIAAVGAGMRERPGLAARLFGTLGECGVNVCAIAQGSSELNISLVVARDDRTAAVQAIHRVFIEPRMRSFPVALAGVGRVGGALLRQLATVAPELEQRGLRLSLVAVAASRGRSIEASGIDPATAAERLERQPEPGEQALPAALAAARCPVAAFVDCTASDVVASWHDAFLQAGAAVVTANKRRLAGPLEGYRSLAAAAGGLPMGRLYFETTVGAGLPVVRTLSELLATGDRMHRIEGVLSGTLSYLAAQLATGRPFSDAVREAYEAGYTEPDPREDLSGQDVARKLLILARVAGRQLEPEEVAVEPLLPDAGWAALSLEAFWQRLPELDGPLEARRRDADAEGRRLAYVAALDDTGARVELRPLAPGHPCGALEGTDNLIAFTTDRYRDTPLVIRGPGAGPEVTAAGVLADLLRAAREAAPAAWD